MPEARVVLATRNAHKVRELTRIFQTFAPSSRSESTGLRGIVFEDLRDHSAVPEVEEDGETFEENAIKKARQVADVLKLPSIADDSGLEVDALGGAPGVRSARYAGADADDARNREKLLQALAGVPDDRRSARFCCVIAIAIPGGHVQTIEGVCEGQITRNERGREGFGYDPLFIPQGETRTFAEMTASEKDLLSHRGIAARRLAEILPGLVLDTPSRGP